MLIFAVRGVDISRLTVHRYMNTELQLFSFYLIFAVSHILYDTYISKKMTSFHLIW